MMINSVNLSTALSILEVFAIESLDVLAKGLLRVLNAKTRLNVEEVVNQTLPRAYDPPVSQVQQERVIDALRERLNHD